MATIDVLKLDGTKCGTIDLADDVFGVAVNRHLLWEAVRYQLAARRRGTHSTKRRDEVRGGGRKPYKQKGTGRARQGSERAPNHVGGGKVFTPKPRDYEYTMPKKARRGALKSALSARATESRITVVEDFELSKIKTKEVIAALKSLGLSKALIIDKAENRNLALSVRNLPAAGFIPTVGVNVYDILKYPALVMTRRSVQEIESSLGG
jgi:large subunit ribosomal protein L4